MTQSIIHKVCAKCGDARELAYHSYCRKCRTAYQKERRAKQHIERRPLSADARARISVAVKRAWTPERRQQASEARKGKPSSTRGKHWKLGYIRKNPRSRGTLNSNWKGGITAEHLRIRNTPEYKAWRTSVFERDDYTCQECGAHSCVGNKVRLNADHIKPFSTHPELRLDVDNGRTLCKPCHQQTPTYGVNARYTT